MNFTQTIRKASIMLAFLSSAVFGFDIDDALAKLSGQQFQMDSALGGMYKNFDTTNKKWVLYMPTNNYLLVHETGKTTTVDGAKQFNPSTTFVSKPTMENLSVAFPTKATSVTDVDIVLLQNQTYSLNSNLSGFYKNFDTTSKLWFLWMPVNNYLLIHETGKNKTADGAVVVNIANTFEGGISFVSDPFGNPVGNTIQFGSLKSGVIVTTNTPPVFISTAETALSLTVGTAFSLSISGYATDINGDTVTYSVTGLGNGLSYDSSTQTISGTPLVAVSSGEIKIYANDGKGGTATHAMSLTVNSSSGGIDTPPEVPDINTSSPLTPPPSVPSI